jgi:hypothetical protein
VQLFPGLSFYRARLGLECLDPIDVLAIFFLKPLDFNLQRLPLGTLLLIYNHSICAEHRVEYQAEGQHKSANRTNPSPFACKPGPDRARSFNVTHRQFLRLRPLFFD